MQTITLQRSGGYLFAEFSDGKQIVSPDKQLKNFAKTVALHVAPLQKAVLDFDNGAIEVMGIAVAREIRNRI